MTRNKHSNKKSNNKSNKKKKVTIKSVPSSETNHSSPKTDAVNHLSNSPLNDSSNHLVDLSKAPVEIIARIFSFYDPLHIYKKYYTTKNEWFKSATLLSILAKAWKLDFPLNKYAEFSSNRSIDFPLNKYAEFSSDNYPINKFIDLLFEYDLKYGTSIICYLYHDERAMLWLGRNDYEKSKGYIPLISSEYVNRLILKDYFYALGKSGISEDSLHHLKSGNSSLSASYQLGKSDQTDTLNLTTIHENEFHNEVLRKLCEIGQTDKLYQYISMKGKIREEDLNPMIQGAVYGNQVELLVVLLCLCPEKFSEMDNFSQIKNIFQYDSYSKSGDIKFKKFNLEIFLANILSFSPEILERFSDSIEYCSMRIPNLFLTSFCRCDATVRSHRTSDDANYIKMNVFKSLYAEWQESGSKDYVKVIQRAIEIDRADILNFILNDMELDYLSSEELLIKALSNHKFISASIIWVKIAKLMGNEGVTKIINTIKNYRTEFINVNKFGYSEYKEIKFKLIEPMLDWIVYRIGNDAAISLQEIAVGISAGKMGLKEIKFEGSL